MKKLLSLSFLLATLFCSSVGFAQYAIVQYNYSQYYFSDVNSGSALPIYSIYAYERGYDGTITSIAFKATGTAADTDVESYSLYRSKFYYFRGDAQLIATASGISLSTTATGVISFNGINAPLNDYNLTSQVDYFYVVANLNSAAILGTTFMITGVENFEVLTTTSNNYTSNAQGTSFSVVSVTGNISGFNNYTSNVAPGQKDIDIAYWSIYSQGGSSSLNSVTLPLSGTFSGSDFDRFKLYYYNYDDDQTSFVASVSGAAFSTVTSSITIPVNFPIAISNYGVKLTLKADASSTVVDNKVLKLNAFDGSAMNVSNTTLTGSNSSISTITFKSAQINVQDQSLVDDGVSPESFNNIIYKSKLNSGSLNSVLQSMVFTTTGTFTSSDIAVFKLWGIVSSSFDNNDSYLIGTITATGSGQILNFTGFRSTIFSNDDFYLYLTTDVKLNATVNNTVSVLQTNLNSSFGFVSGTVSGTTLTPANFTIKRPNIAISQLALSSANIGVGASQVLIYKMKMTATVAKAFLKEAAFKLGGTYTSNEINYFRLDYGTSPDYNNSSYASELNNYSGAGATITFTGMNITLDNISDVYFFLTINTETSSEVGKTINVASEALSNMVFPSSVKSGSISTGSTFTFAKATVSATSIPLTNGSIAVGSNYNPIYKIELNVSNAPVVLNSLKLPTGGTYNSSDLKYSYSFRLIYSSNAIFDDSDDETFDYNYGSNSTGSGENLNLSFSRSLPVGKSYIFVVTDITSGAVSGNTIYIKPFDAASSFLAYATTLSGSLAKGATFTIKKPNPKITSIPWTGSVIIAPNNQYNLVQTIEFDSDVPFHVSNLDIAMGGTYASSDFAYYYIYKSTSPVFDQNDYINDYYFTSYGTGQTLSSDFGDFGAGKTYLHITPYVNSGATLGNTVDVSTISGVDIQNGNFVSLIAPGTELTILKSVTITPFSPQSYIATAGQNNYLYGFRLIPNSTNYLNGLVFTLSGTLNTSLLSGFKLYSNSYSNSLNSVNYITNGIMNGNVVSFSGLNEYISTSYNAHFFVSANIANTTTTGETVKIEPTSLADFIFSNTTLLGTYSLPQANVLTSPVVSVATFAYPSANLNPDANAYYPIYRIELNANSAARINTLPLSVLGNYNTSQVNNFTIFKAYTPTFDLNNYVNSFPVNSTKTVSSLTGEDLLFTLNDEINSGMTYYFVTVQLTNTTNVGANLQVVALSVPGVILNNGAVAGTSVQGNVFTTKIGSVALSTVDVPGRLISKYYTYENIYTIKATVTDADVNISNIQFQTKGNYAANGFYYIYAYLSSSPVYSPFDLELGGAYSYNTGNSTNYNLNISGGKLSVGNNYIHLVANSYYVADITIGINALTVNSANFNGNVPVTGSLTSGNLFTTTGNYLGTYDDMTMPVTGGKINKGASKLIYAVKSSISGASIDANNLYIAPKGSFVREDITNVTLWYSESATFDNSAIEVSNTYVIDPNVNFSLSIYKWLPIGDYYFYVTADVSATATDGHTLYIESTTGNNLSILYALPGTYNFSQGSTFVFGVPSNNNTLISFVLPNQVDNTTITGTEVLINMPIGTNLTTLVGTFGIDPDAKAYVNSVLQQSGVSANDFTNLVTYTIVSETGLQKTYIVKVTLVTVSGLTSIVESTSKSGLVVYPNPSETGIYHLQTSGASITLVYVYNSIGESVYSAGDNSTIDISSLPAGIYLVRVVLADNKAITVKVKKG